MRFAALLIPALGAHGQTRNRRSNHGRRIVGHIDEHARAAGADAHGVAFFQAQRLPFGDGQVRFQNLAARLQGAEFEPGQGADDEGAVQARGQAAGAGRVGADGQLPLRAFLLGRA